MATKTTVVAQLEEDPFHDIGAPRAGESVVVLPPEESPDFLASQQRRLRGIEDQILERGLRIMSSALHFEEIEPGEKGVPDEWVKELGLVGAMNRLRMANAAWENKKTAPVGLNLAMATTLGIIKARATERAQPVQLNIGSVQLSAPLPDFERLRLRQENSQR